MIYREIGEPTLIVGDKEETLIPDGYDNVYYIETTHEIGKLDEAVTISVNVGQNSVEYDVSVYSYMAIALEQGDDSVKTLGRALYDLKEAAK